MNDFTNETATWLEAQLDTSPKIELEIGCLIAAATDWTEDETELDDLVAGLFEFDQVALSIG
jgi:hypothetical protein